MSIVCTDADEATSKRCASKVISKVIHVTIDPKTTNQLNLPKDYKYSSCVLPKKYEAWAHRLQNFKIRPDDVWVVGFPKTGTTWTHNIAWKLMHNLDFDAPYEALNNRSFEVPTIVEEKPTASDEYQRHFTETGQRYDRNVNLSSPRVLKAHSPAYLLPKDIWTVKPKIIYVARNPKDMIVSLYHMSRSIAAGYERSLNDLCEDLMNDQVLYTPFHDHILSFWQIRHLDHVLFLTYEELSADRAAGIKRISDFLGCQYSDEQLKQLMEHVSFSKMRETFPNYYSAQIVGAEPDPNYKLVFNFEALNCLCLICVFCRFCRKGKVGGYRDDLSPEMINKLNEWSKKQLKDSDFKFLE